MVVVYIYSDIGMLFIKNHLHHYVNLQRYCFNTR